MRSPISKIVTRSSYKQQLKNTIQLVDENLLQCYLNLFGDPCGVRGLLFHTVFSHPDEITDSQIHPQQKLFVDDYRFIFEYFLQHNYHFLKYTDLKEDLEPKGRYIYVTFDDGYYNNIKILRLIEELNIPIHLFVTTDNIANNRKYWWDVIYHHRKRSGVARKKIEAELVKLKGMSYEFIERYITDEFGRDAFQPLSDLDRPLSPDDLLELSRHELVTIGNHTRHHVIVTTLDSEEFRGEVFGANEDIKVITGQEASGFAFPNGNYRPRDIDLLASIGIDIAFSCEPRNNKISNQVSDRCQLFFGRYCLSGSSNLEWQAKMVRAGGSPFFQVQQLRARLRG